MREPEQATGNGARRTDPEFPGFWLRNCRRLSLALSRHAAVRRLWAGASRGMRQYWAGRVCSEIWAPLPGSVRVPVRLWDHVEAGIFWYGFPAEDKAAFRVLSSALAPDGVLIDVGANIGAFALPLGAQARRGAVHAFEPASGTADRLRRNRDLNRLDNIVVNQDAVSDRSGSISIWVPATRWKGRLYNTGMTSAYVGNRQSGWHEEVVSAVRLDDYTREQNLPRVDAMKIDVEGAELDVLEGARALIRQYRPLVVMEVNQAPLQAAGRRIDDVTRFWRAMDYRVGVIAGNGTVRWELVPGPGSGHQNICCAPLEN